MSPRSRSRSKSNSTTTAASKPSPTTLKPSEENLPISSTLTSSTTQLTMTNSTMQSSTAWLLQTAGFSPQVHPGPATAYSTASSQTMTLTVTSPATTSPGETRSSPTDPSRK